MISTYGSADVNFPHLPKVILYTTFFRNHKLLCPVGHSCLSQLVIFCLMGPCMCGNAVDL